MNFFFIYFFTYILTLSGFLLGKSTTDEHKEIKKYILKYYTKIIISLFYMISIGLFYEQTLITILISILFIFHISFWKKKDILHFMNIISLGILLPIYYYLKLEYVYIVLILICVIIAINSFKKFNRKEIAYEIIFYIMTFVVINTILK